ncbi:hypothetical protein TRFO_20701 [Tritrichomonas foetus]|uniref:HECT domain-containing protein n=1 Tax=Tritrichomonas foetus TaxID=1144522 RepID=A0A1J4KGG9_9EUKA|nr:hypothetical protein TRFO_20701 [Tritrichomonas foetus]|eukprot:OHT10146.1 hypothetical protein TRFO_20701 [Tritrichomonas foetus]
MVKCVRSIFSMSFLHETLPNNNNNDNDNNLLNQINETKNKLLSRNDEDKIAGLILFHEIISTNSQTYLLNQIDQTIYLFLTNFMKSSNDAIIINSIKCIDLLVTKYPQRNHFDHLEIFNSVIYLLRNREHKDIIDALISLIHNYIFLEFNLFQFRADNGCLFKGLADLIRNASPKQQIAILETLNQGFDCSPDVQDLNFLFNSLQPILKRREKHFFPIIIEFLEKLWKINKPINFLSKNSIIDLFHLSLSYDDLELTKKTFDILNFVQTSNDFYLAVNESGLVFKELLSNEKYFTDITILSSCLKMILHILPDPGLPKKYLKYHSTPIYGAFNFANEIKEAILNLILMINQLQTSFSSNSNTSYSNNLNFNNSNSENADNSESITCNLLDLFASIISIISFKLEQNLICYFSGFISSEYVPFILIIATKMLNPIDAVCNNWLYLFNMIRLDDFDSDQWYKDKIGEFLKIIGPAATFDDVGQNIESFDDFLSLLSTIKSTHLYLASSETFHYISLHLTKILKQENKKNNFDFEKYKPNFLSLVKIINNFLAIANFENSVNDPLTNIPLQDLLKRGFSVDIYFPDSNNNRTSLTNIVVSADIDFCGIETYINSYVHNIQPLGFLHQIINLEDNKQLSLMTIGALLENNKDTSPFGYSKYSYSINNYHFSVYEPLFHSLLRSYNSIEDLTSLSPKINIKYKHDSNHENQKEKITCKIELNEKSIIIDCIHILQQIHEIFPEFDFFNQKLEKIVLSQLKSLPLIIGFKNFASQIVYHAPFLFSLNFRFEIFKIVAFDLYLSIKTFQNLVSKPDDISRNDLPLNNTIILPINKNNIFDSGKDIFGIIGEGLTRFVVNFQKLEKSRTKMDFGVEMNNTQEFLILFAEEISKDETKQWRKKPNLSTLVDQNHIDNNNNNNDNNELFPAPNADPSFFYMLGTLTAKAILMEMSLPIKINPAFFDLVLGNPISLKQVDTEIFETLNESLLESLIGRSFTYPNYPELEMIENGANIVVNRENLQDYINLFKEFTIGSKVILFAEEYKRGFETVGRTEFLKLFSSQELSTLLSK